MKIVKVSYKTEVSLVSLFKTWIGLYNGFFATPYFKNLLSFIAGSYKMSLNMLPTRPRDVFKPFRSVDYNNLKVVIIGDYPFANHRNSGIAYANKNLEYSKPSKVTELIRRKIETTMYNGLRLDFDYSMKKWGEQGVLLLNSALTCVHGDPKLHRIYWREFLRVTISKLSQKETGLIFVFWGDDANYFSQEVDEKFNYILRAESPSTAMYEQRRWDCNHFEEINEIIERDIGVQEQIEWS